MKRASYGQLSTRHLGVEAGLGTLGLEVNILTPEFGPRLYLTGILTELELEPDQRMEEQVCIGESCSRCLHSCPPDAVRQWGLDKARLRHRGAGVRLHDRSRKFFEQFHRHADRSRKRAAVARATCSASGRACCAWSARSATARAASRCARSATTTTRTSPTSRSTSRRRRRRRWPRPPSFKQARKEGHDLPGLVRVEHPLGRREGLPGHRCAAAAGVQAAAEREGEAVNIFKRKLTAGGDQGQGARARRRPGRHRRRREDRHQPHHRARRRPRDRARHARAGAAARASCSGTTATSTTTTSSRSPSSRRSRSSWCTGWRTRATRRSSCRRRTSIPWRYDGDPKKHQRHADLAAARGGRGGPRHARPEPAAADARNSARACCSPRCSARSTSSATSR